MYRPLKQCLSLARARILLVGAHGVPEFGQVADRRGSRVLPFTPPITIEVYDRKPERAVAKAKRSRSRSSRTISCSFGPRGRMGDTYVLLSAGAAPLPC